MTFDARVQALAKTGFTERQARFVVTVMLHSGVCVPRQYATFCSIVHGQKTRKFFDKLVRVGCAPRSTIVGITARAFTISTSGRYIER